jgi:hypothetical protein
MNLDCFGSKILFYVFYLIMLPHIILRDYVSIIIRFLPKWLIGYWFLLRYYTHRTCCWVALFIKRAFIIDTWEELLLHEADALERFVVTLSTIARSGGKR